MRDFRLSFLLIGASVFFIPIFAAPSEPSFVVSTSTTTTTTTPTPPLHHEDNANKENEPTENLPSVPKIYQMHVRSNISNRFAHTTVISKVKNSGNTAQEATFAVVLPESAFIAGFIMEVNGKNYTAYVKEKEEAKKVYDEAVASGLGAAHVAVSARDSNRFTVSVNIEPESKAAFYLSYEQLLQRQDGRYEQIINLHPGQPVKDLAVEVVITESRKLVDVKAPPLRSGNEIGNEKVELDPRADIEIVNETAAIVKFTPSLERQKQLTHLLGKEEKDGLAGQFVVQYDVERDPHGGEVLIQDGYFVHFFAPTELKPLPKYVVFVLDTSGSMYNQKIEQLKQAMHKILDELHEHDSFSLVEFNSNVKVWNLDATEESVWYPKNNHNYNFNDEEASFENVTFPPGYKANPDNIKKAKVTVSELSPDGGTDIYTALKVGLHLVELSRDHKIDDIHRQPIVVFLTDGDPTVRITSPEEIITKTGDLNSGSSKSPIFALSFGRGADKKFLQKLALRNSGFSKHIYEAADASLQLQDFYKQISSPLLADVTFKYEPSVTSLTNTDFPIHFGGSELVVSGWCGTITTPPIVKGWGIKGEVILKPTVQESVSSIERLWAYMTVQQYLEKAEIANETNKKELKQKALDLSLKYSFVTSVSSLVVVKPNATNAAELEDAADGSHNSHNRLQPAHYGHVAFAQNRPILLASPGNHFAQEAIADSAVFTIPPVAYSTTYLPPVRTSTAATPHTSNTPPTTSATDSLFRILPWLKNIVTENDILSLPEGKYKLGQNETISDIVECPKTPLNAPGHCSLLHACPQVHSLLTSSDLFIEHLCILKNEYAGVCCPNVS